MRKAIAFFSVFLLVAVASYSQKLSVRAGHGFGVGFGGDIAAGIRGLSDYLSDTYAATDSFGAPGFGLSFSAEAVYRLNSKMGVGLGVGYFSAGKESEVSYTVDTLAVTQTLHPRLGVLPLLSPGRAGKARPRPQRGSRPLSRPSQP